MQQIQDNPFFLRRFSSLIVAVLFTFLTHYSSSLSAAQSESQLWVVANGNETFESLTSQLQNANLIDAELNWIAGTTVLVNLGDYGNSYQDAETTLGFLFKIRQQAAKVGGNVHLILGEQDLRKLVQQSTQGWQKGGRFATELAASAETIVKVDDYVFVHQGLHDSLSDFSIDAINSKFRQRIASIVDSTAVLEQSQILSANERLLDISNDDFLDITDSKGEAVGVQANEWLNSQRALLFNRVSPTNYQGTTACHPVDESYDLEPALGNFGAKTLVIGHQSKYKASSILMYGLVIVTGDNSQAPSLIELSEQSIAQLTPGFNAFPILPEGMTDEDVEAFLSSAEVITSEKIGVGVTNSSRLTLKNGSMQMDALFKTFDNANGLEHQVEENRLLTRQSDRYIYEVAAYKLDRELDFNMITPAVIREIDGVEGSLQMWLPAIYTEADRDKKDIGFDSVCDKEKQFRLRVIFDILIYNEDRNQGNIAWTKKDDMLFLIDHSRAFRNDIRRPKQYAKSTIRISNYTKELLNTLNIEDINPLLRNYLNRRQTRAILSRRKMLLQQAE